MPILLSVGISVVNYMIYKKDCIVCGIEMVIKYDSEYKKRGESWKYCSMKCKSSYLKSITKACVGCNVQYHPHDSKTKYCSRDCLNKSKRAENHKNWIGEKVQYSALHRWIVRSYGNPLKCEHCGITGSRPKSNWNIHWSNKDGLYTRNISDWQGLCYSCHRKYDYKNRQKRASLIDKNGKLTFLFTDL